MSQPYIIGDTHLGQVFKTGVPPHRMGDREEMIWQQFAAEIDAGFAHGFCIQMGDLFHKRVVSMDVLMRTYRIIESAALRYPEAQCFILAGNHDTPSNTNLTSSLQLLAIMLSRFTKVRFVPPDNPMTGVVVFQDADGVSQTCHVGLFSWHPFLSAAEIADKVRDNHPGTGWTAYGHWDVVAFGENTHNLLPAQTLKEHGAVAAVTGHDHVRRQVTLHGLPVQVQGSMQPYGHGQDPNGDRYLTVTLEELRRMDPEELIDKCVRVRLAAGETITGSYDCLQLTELPYSYEAEQDTVLPEVDLNSFDLLDTVQAAMTRHQVTPELQDELTTIMLDTDEC